LSIINCSKLARLWQHPKSLSHIRAASEEVRTCRPMMTKPAAEIFILAPHFDCSFFGLLVFIAPHTLDHHRPSDFAMT
jgi:hypothetical protein